MVVHGCDQKSWETKVWEMLSQTRSFPYHAVQRLFLPGQLRRHLGWVRVGYITHGSSWLQACGCWLWPEVILPAGRNPGLSLHGKPRFPWKSWAWESLIPENSPHSREVTTRVRRCYGGHSAHSPDSLWRSAVIAKTLTANVYWTLTACWHFTWVIWLLIMLTGFSMSGRNKKKMKKS